MAKELITAQEAIERGYKWASDSELQIMPLTSIVRNSLLALEYNYVVLKRDDGSEYIDDDGLQLQLPQSL